MRTVILGVLMAGTLFGWGAFLSLVKPWKAILAGLAIPWYMDLAAMPVLGLHFLAWYWEMCFIIACYMQLVFGHASAPGKGRHGRTRQSQDRP